MPKVVIITNPAHDDATKYLHAWSEKTKTDLSNILTNIEIHELKNDQVTKDNLTRIIEEKNPHLILFHGHGGTKKIFGFEANVLIEYDNNEDLLNERIIHSLSCDSGRELGPKCIALGTKAYIGYKDEFKFFHTGRTTPRERYTDPIAELFLKPAFEINKALLEGETVEQAYSRSQAIYSQTIQILLTSNNPNINTTYAGIVYHDMINQVALGNRNTSF